MKIGIISDSHGCCEALGRVFELFGDADCIIHAGDILYHPPRLYGYEGYDVIKCVELINGLRVPFVSVRGNCDSEVYTELMPGYAERETTVLGVHPCKIVVNHGTRLNTAAMVSLAKDCDADVFVSGHTHVPVLEKRDGVTLINPGSIGIPRYPAADPVPTAGLIDNGHISVFDIRTGRVFFEDEL
ncbi:MAG: phosphodiesterase [Abditibacteriota bacterium]|nr:phosphodiesterase [Abditibacteriota bacterium]